MSAGRTLLVLFGQGGPEPDAYGPALAPLADLVTLYVPGLLRDPEAQVAAMRRHGDALAAPSAAELVEVGAAAARERRIDGVLTFSEPLIASSAELAARLGRRHHSPEAVAAVTSKWLQRQRLAAAGVPTPRHALIESEADLAAAVRAVGLPAVLKPVIGMGSSLVATVDSPEELRARHARAVELHASDVRVDGAPARFVLEELLVGADWYGDPRMGDYVSVESLTFEGETSHVTVTGKLPLAPPFRETGDVMPAPLSGPQREAVTDLTTRALAALGLTDGASHTEIKLTADGPRVIEVNGRLGGGVALLLPLLTGFDIVTEIGRIALGEPPAPPPKLAGFATMLNPHSPPQDVRIAAIRGFDELRAIPGIRHAELLLDVGAVPDWRRGMSWLYYAYGSAPSLAELFALQDRAATCVEVAFEPVADGAP